MVFQFRGESFSLREMKQYTDNTIKKLLPYLSNEKVVIEIGCASGLTMFHVAPYVKKYIGTDMAKQNLLRNGKRIANDSIANIVLKQCSADKILEAVDTKADVVIMNSVVQYFPDMEYFENVIRDCLSMLNPGGVLYIGDLLDKELLPVFLEELKIWKQAHPNSRSVKLDRSDELWIRREYFKDMERKYEWIHDIQISNKVGEIANELTKYRYDVVIIKK